MDRSYDAVLLIGFGGPNTMGEVRPFLANVLRGRPAPPQRIEEVVRRYESIGGRSPFNELTLRQASALQRLLQAEGPAMPVYVGMRNWHPYFHETLAEIRQAQAYRVVGFILAAQQSDASWGRYQREVAEACASLGAGAPRVDFVGGWHAHPLFIEAVADRAEEALRTIPPERSAAARLVFTAHSIPTAMAAASPYVAQIEEGSRLIAKRLGRLEYTLAYQSRSGNPQEAWLEPDIGTVLRDQAAAGTRDVVLAPMGFLCDHMEVIYDLDIEVKNLANALGVHLVRAKTVSDHPAFIRAMAAVIRQHVAIQ